MTPSGVKTESSDAKVTANYVEEHIRIGVDSIKELQEEGRSIKHLKWR
jgi:AMP nucleosidase